MPRARRQLGVLALFVALAAFPLGALASHDFADVSAANSFHADISALTNSGVTSGCGGGNFCPSANVTREQMAAFLNRLGALAPGKTPVVNAAKLGGLAAGQLARKDQVQHFTCSAADLLPTLGSLDYEGGFGYRYLTSGVGSLACGVHVPDGATVTSLAGYVIDTTGSAETSCGMYRIPFGSEPVVMALTATSGVANSAGTLSLIDASITDPVVDNSLNAYSAWCAGDGAVGLELATIKIAVTYIGAP